MLTAFELWKLFIEKHLTLDVKTTFRLQKHHFENISQKHIKNESCKCYLGNNEQKTMFLVVSQSDAHFSLKHPFFECPIRHARKLRARKIRHLERNLSTPVGQVPQQLFRKSPLFFGIFSIMLSICFFHLVVT